MLISNVHKSIIVMNSLDTRFSKNVFEAVQKTCSTCFIGSKTIRLRLVVLNPIKQSCSFFKHYITSQGYLFISLHHTLHKLVTLSSTAFSGTQTQSRWYYSEQTSHLIGLPSFGSLHAHIIYRYCLRFHCLVKGNLFLCVGKWQHVVVFNAVYKVPSEGLSHWIQTMTNVC